MRPESFRRILVGLLFCGTLAAQPPQHRAPLNRNLQEFSREFFRWRAVTQPCSSDDIPRVERPDGWIPDFSPATLRAQQQKYLDFRRSLRELPRDGWSRSDSVDFLLLSSAIEKINWELNVLRLPFRNPDFYTQQTLGAVHELLFLTTPLSDKRLAEILRRIRSIPVTLHDARANLTEPVRPFALLSIENLAGARAMLRGMRDALNPRVDAKFRQPLASSTDSAATALEEFVAYLRARLPAMSDKFSCGKEVYGYFLGSLAFIPITPAEMLTIGKSEFDRAVASEILEASRNRDLPSLPLFPSAAAQIAREKVDERAIRKFLNERNLLTVPETAPHYIQQLTPDYLEPMSSIAMNDDLTSDTRLNEDGVSYIPPPSPSLSFFRLATAKDSRPIIIHEGVPGHFFQMQRAWVHDDPVRRRFFDSGPIEGWGMYVEEMLLQAGLFDTDRPQTRQTIYTFMRLRALRVEADIRLALGEFTIEQAADFLERTVPMDRETAQQEASFFASTPGQAISYQIGKHEIVALLAEVRLANGAHFDLRKFHDDLAQNANVPIELLRWEYLGPTKKTASFWEAAIR